MSKYLDQDGLLYFWQKIKAKLAGKVDVVTGKGLSTNDYTTAEKEKLAGLSNYTLPTASSSTKGGIKVGSGLSISDEVLSAPVFGGASSTTNGSVGIVPAPTKDDYAKYLKADGTWTFCVDEKVKTTKRGTNIKVYLLGTPNAPTVGGTTAPAIGEPSVYVDGGLETGVLHASSFVGDGASLTNLNASNIATGTLPPSTVPVMTGATASTAGAKGAVPAPASGEQTKFLRGDGTWASVVTNDTKVNVTLATTTKAYLLATTTTPTSTATGTAAVADTWVYLDTTAGQLTANSFSGNGSALTSLNASNISSGTIAAERLPAASASAAGAMSAADYQKLAAFGSASSYALKSDITNMYKHKGSVATESALPTTGNTAGDVYNVTATGMNYVWTGDAWDALGEIFSIDSITNSEIDTILAA